MSGPDIYTKNIKWILFTSLERKYSQVNPPQDLQHNRVFLDVSVMAGKNVYSFKNSVLSNQDSFIGKISAADIWGGWGGFHRPGFGKNMSGRAVSSGFFSSLMAQMESVQAFHGAERWLMKILLRNTKIQSILIFLSWSSESLLENMHEKFKVRWKNIIWYFNK